MIDAAMMLIQGQYDLSDLFGTGDGLGPKLLYMLTVDRLKSDEFMINGNSS